jgi:hypothetical protein
MDIKKKSASAENALNTHQNDNTKLSQCQKILRYMTRNGGITQLDATYNGMGTRLSARIWDLRNIGIDITDDWETKDDARFVRYSTDISALIRFLSMRSDIDGDLLLEYMDYAGINALRHADICSLSDYITQKGLI